MAFAHLILWERTSRWAVAWRRSLRGKVRVIETRTAMDCDLALKAYSASFVGIEALPQRAAEVGSKIAQWRDCYPDCLLVALGGQELTPWDLYFREAGAFDVLQSRRDIPRLAPLIVRHVGRFPTAPPTWKQELWSKLPWNGVNSSFPS